MLKATTTLSFRFPELSQRSEAPLLLEGCPSSLQNSLVLRRIRTWVGAESTSFRPYWRNRNDVVSADRKLRNHRQHAHSCFGGHERFDRLVLLPTLRDGAEHEKEPPMPYRLNGANGEKRRFERRQFQARTTSNDVRVIKGRCQGHPF